MVERISAGRRLGGLGGELRFSLSTSQPCRWKPRPNSTADGPDVVFAGGLFPVQKAERVDGGWNVRGVEVLQRMPRR